MVRCEVLVAEPGTPGFLRWSEVPITFDRSDHLSHVPWPGCYPFVVDPINGTKKLSRVLMDGGNDLNMSIDRSRLSRRQNEVAEALAKMASGQEPVPPGIFASDKASPSTRPPKSKEGDNDQGVGSELAHPPKGSESSNKPGPSGSLGKADERASVPDPAGVPLTTSKEIEAMVVDDSPLGQLIELAMR